MTDLRTDADTIRTTRNTARFFTENRQIAWVVLIATVLWGLYGYTNMPKRKDPVFPVIYAAAVGVWPGATAERVEQLLTRRIEEVMAENPRVERIESTSRSNVSIVVVMLDERTTDPGREWDDIGLRLNALRDLPPGAEPVEFIRDFGDTLALMLTVASPKVDAVELSLRARDVRAAIAEARASVPADAGPRASMVVSFPVALTAAVAERHRDLVVRELAEAALITTPIPIGGPGFVGVDFTPAAEEAVLFAAVDRVLTERLVPGEYHPDVWQPALIGDPSTTDAALTRVAGDRYTYRELDVFTELVKRTLQTVPQVSKVSRSGLLPEQVFLEYSQEQLTTTNVPITRLMEVLEARNISVPGGMLDVAGTSLLIDPSGEFTSEQDIGNVIVGSTPGGRPVYLRDAVEITRGYETPPSYLNYYHARDESGTFRRARAITLGVQMRPGEQIAEFGAATDAALARLASHLPDDLVLARPSDQPLQVRENVGLFMGSLYEAIVLVVLVALVGFWQWRSAVIIALTIPITLAATFGMMDMLGLDLQQVSIASLIIALGLLVDDPVVATDAIKRDLDAGHPGIIAAWLGPTRLATPMYYTTLTNIVAYLPLLLINSQTGMFIYSLPVVLACALVASRLVSMTFIPLLGYYLLRPSATPAVPAVERRERGLTGLYYRSVGWAIDHRKVVLAAALLVLVAGGAVVSQLRVQFFPKDLAYLSYVDVWLPEDATIGATSAVAARAAEIVQRVAGEYGRSHPDRDGNPRDVLASVTTFVGGGGPRFWFSVSSELMQPNYAQLIVNVRDKLDTSRLVTPLQFALSAEIPGARIDVRELESGKTIGVPVAIRLSGENMTELRRLSAEVRDILRNVPTAARVRDSWGSESFKVRLQVDSDRANLAGVTNLDVAISSVVGMNGMKVTTLRQGDQQIPVVARLRVDERARLSDVQSLYVFPLDGDARVPLQQVSTVDYTMSAEKIVRRNQFRTITVSAFPVAGVLPAEVLDEARPALAAFADRLPSGYLMDIGGEHEEQVKGFEELTGVMLVSVAAIFLALVVQFRSAVTPWIVFSAIPFGVLGGLLTLIVMGAPFGFMAFLGVASLIGVIVSNVIVLFDFIEEMRREGRPIREALLDAGIGRLRPIMITAGATVFGLIPLARSGGPLWEALCYTQIGGLTTAVFVTLILVPVIYSVFVLDLKIVRWDATPVEAS